MECPPRREMNKAIRAFFDERASIWDTDVSRVSVERLQSIIADLDIAAGARLLDVGTGTGVLFPILAPRIGPNGLVVAVDLAAGMLDEARAKAKGVPIACLQADVMDCPIVGPYFDWIICNSCFPHFADQQHALLELAACLKPGGRLLVCHTESRQAINDFHQSVGHVVGGHILPDNTEMVALLRNAALVPLEMVDRPDRYIALARKHP